MRGDERSRSPLRGGTDGNELLTVGTGALLFVLLGALGVTILLIGTLIEAHLIIGLVLVPPVSAQAHQHRLALCALLRGRPAIRREGPAGAGLRLLGPLVILMTVIVFGSGIVLLLETPHHDNKVLLVHKASFILWLGLTAIHVLGHAAGDGPRAWRGLGSALPARRRSRPLGPRDGARQRARARRRACGRPLEPLRRLEPVHDVGGGGH